MNASLLELAAKASVLAGRSRIVPTRLYEFFSGMTSHRANLTPFVSSSIAQTSPVMLNEPFTGLAYWHYAYFLQSPENNKGFKPSVI